jgi:RsiW-degrading membrane proteinase PrsW (M82 family)
MIEFREIRLQKIEINSLLPSGSITPTHNFVEILPIICAKWTAFWVASLILGKSLLLIANLQYIWSSQSGRGGGSWLMTSM